MSGGINSELVALRVGVGYPSVSVAHGDNEIDQPRLSVVQWIIRASSIKIPVWSRQKIGVLAI